jgi:MFS family permease
VTPGAAGAARLGPFSFAPGWLVGNALTVFVASFLTIGMAAFISFAQPYLLNEVLHLPAGEQGRLTGSLGALQEIIVIALASLVGAWSDRVGRRPVYVLGFVLMAAAYLIYPLAGSVGELVIYRCAFAVGIATAPLMLSACVVDAIQERSRGRWIATNNLFQGLGVVAMSVGLAKLPAFFAARGASPATAGRFTFWIATGICLVAAALLARGLPRLIPAPSRGVMLLRQAASAVRSAADNPRLALSYGAAFIGRGDFTVIGTYFSLWIVQVGAERGVASGAALVKAGMLFGVLQLAALLWALFMGIIADRLDRVTSLCIALTLAGAGYLLMGQVRDPFGPGLLPVAILLGFGEISVIVASGALLGQEAPLAARGPVIGLYNAVGGVGILFATFFGGQLFDRLGRTAPFTVMGLLNILLLIVALALRLRQGARLWK